VQLNKRERAQKAASNHIAAFVHLFFSRDIMMLFINARVKPTVQTTGFFPREFSNLLMFHWFCRNSDAVYFAASTAAASSAWNFSVYS
jgi:hypothetical protein